MISLGASDGGCGRRLTSRPDREPRSVDDLLEARLAGRIDRRELIERAALLGIAAPVVAVVLHVSGDVAGGSPTRARSATLARVRAQEGSAAETATVDAPTQPLGPHRRGGTLTIAATVEPDTLHPWLTQSIAGFDILEGVMDGLLRYDSQQQFQAALAQGFEISDDGVTYTFALRRDARFHNGDSFGASDFEAAWQTKLDPSFGAYSVLGWDKIASVEAPDETTLVVTTTEPYAPFLSYVATSFLCPATAIADGMDAFRESFGRSPIGTGPMQLATWTPGERIELDRFDDYWGEQPKLERVVYRIVSDAAAQIAALADGEAQLIGGESALSGAQVVNAVGLQGITVLEHPTHAWQHLDLKQAEFLRETDVRQALDFATPRQRIIDELVGGRAVPAAADQAPGTWAFHPSLEPRPYDLDQARALLDAAGLEIGSDGVRMRDDRPFTIELWGVAGNPLAERSIEMIAESWGAIGVATTPRFGDRSIWGPMGYQFSDRMTACLYTWTNTNDPDDMFYWHSSQIPTSPTGSGANLPAFFAPYAFQAEIDELTARAATTTARGERQSLYLEIQELLHEEVPVIFLYWEQAFPVVANNVGGFWPSAFNQLLWNVQDWYLTENGSGQEEAEDPASTGQGTPDATSSG